MFRDTVLKNRSYRGFNQDRKITREELVDLVDIARFAPSSVNLQPLKYRVVFEEREMVELRPLMQWARALTDITLPHEGMQPTGAIVICLDENITTEYARVQKDIGIVAQTMLLGSIEKGLGGCMIGNFVPSRVSNALAIPEKIKPQLIIAFGEPKEEIVLTEVSDGESIAYYRDENDVHYVPKKKLDDIIL